MHRVLLSFLLCLLACNLVQARPLSDRVRQSLEELDAIIAGSDVYEHDKLERIQILKRSLKLGLYEAENYWLNSELYNEYLVYDSDSALVYASANLSISQRLNDATRIAQWKSRKSFELIMNGLMHAAEEELEGIRSAALDTATRIEYFEQKLHLYSHILLYDADRDREHYAALVPIYKDSIAQICLPGHPMYLWYKANRVEEGTHEMEEVRQGLLETMKVSAFNSRIDAMNAWALAEIYRKQNNEEESLVWLSKSAIADVKSATKDIASLQQLSQRMYDYGDYERAHRYITYCHKVSIDYNNRVRLYSIAKISNTITDGLLGKLEKNQTLLTRFVYALSFLFVISIILSVWVFLVNKRMRRIHKVIHETNRQLKTQKTELFESNSKLEELNVQLKDLNAKLASSVMQLNESNFVKEQYIGAVFQLCSSYIKKMDDFRRNINRKLKANLYDEAKNITESPNEVQAVVKEFYRSFDNIFLTVYPTFVDDFNALLQPAERIRLKEGELLTTELRIYALVRMGITDSLRISQVLHCSPQTVYNNRNKTRNKALSSREDFDEQVANIGKS